MDGEELRWTVCCGGNGMIDFEALERVKKALDSIEGSYYNLSLSVGDTETITLTKKKEEEDKKNPVGFA